MKRLYLFSVVALVLFALPLSADTIVESDFTTNQPTLTNGFVGSLNSGEYEDFWAIGSTGGAPDLEIDRINDGQPAGNFLAARDQNGSGGTIPGYADWTGIDISAYTNLNLGLDIWANAGGGSQDGDWDNGNSFAILVQLDGGGFNALGIFTGDGSDNASDGVFTLGDSSTRVNYAVGNGNLLDIRIMSSSTVNDNVVVFDNMKLQGDLRPDAIPEPATYALMGLGLAGIAFLRRRCSR